MVDNVFGSPVLVLVKDVYNQNAVYIGTIDYSPRVALISDSKLMTTHTNRRHWTKTGLVKTFPL